MKRTKIIAVDFDGTLIEEGHFPGIGGTNHKVLEYCKAEQARGAKIILWTNREGDSLQTAVDWCKANDLHLDAVNDNIPETIAYFGLNSRKIYADEFIDDRMLGGFYLSYHKRVKPLSMDELIEVYKSIYLHPYYNSYEVEHDPIINVTAHETIPYAIVVEHASGFARDFYVLEEGS